MPLAMLQASSITVVLPAPGTAVTLSLKPCDHNSTTRCCDAVSCLITWHLYSANSQKI